MLFSVSTRHLAVAAAVAAWISFGVLDSIRDSWICSHEF